MASYMNIIFKEIIKMLVLGVTSLSCQHTCDPPLHWVTKVEEHFSVPAKNLPGLLHVDGQLFQVLGRLELAVEQSLECCPEVFCWVEVRILTWPVQKNDILVSKPIHHLLWLVTCDRGGHLAERWTSLSWSWTAPLRVVQLKWGLCSGGGGNQTMHWSNAEHCGQKSNHQKWIIFLITFKMSYLSQNLIIF